jgi:hypothetical protein
MAVSTPVAEALHGEGRGPGLAARLEADRRLAAALGALPAQAARDGWREAERQARAEALGALLRAARAALRIR